MIGIGEYEQKRINDAIKYFNLIDKRGNINLSNIDIERHIPDRGDGYCDVELYLDGALAESDLGCEDFNEYLDDMFKGFIKNAADAYGYLKIFNYEDKFNYDMVHFKDEIFSGKPLHGELRNRVYVYCFFGIFDTANNDKYERIIININESSEYYYDIKNLIGEHFVEKFNSIGKMKKAFFEAKETCKRNDIDNMEMIKDFNSFIRENI